MGDTAGTAVGGIVGVLVAGGGVSVEVGVLAGRGVTVSGGLSVVGVGYMVGDANGVYVAVGVFVGKGVGVIVGVVVMVGVVVRVGSGVRVTITRVSPGSGVASVLLSSITTGPMVPSGVGVGLSTGPLGADVKSQAEANTATNSRPTASKKAWRALLARTTTGRMTVCFIREKL